MLKGPSGPTSGRRLTTFRQEQQHGLQGLSGVSRKSRGRNHPTHLGWRKGKKQSVQSSSEPAAVPTGGISSMPLRGEPGSHQRAPGHALCRRNIPPATASSCLQLSTPSTHLPRAALGPGQELGRGSLRIRFLCCLLSLGCASSQKKA